jgi:hypothetical protein
MPFLTRDFAVFLGIVTFLIGGIFVTVTEDYFDDRQVASVVQFAEVDEVEYKVEEAAPVENTRPTKLAELRKKVGEYMKSVVVEKEPVEENSEPVVVSVPVEEDGAVEVCSNYLVYGGQWNPRGLKFEVVEGARLVYRELAPAAVLPAATSSIETVPLREVITQLPLRSFPNKNTTCLSSDVIGIATDGSLIRNNELSLYKIFGSETLVGYTLDGFTIYGSGETDLDKCGGKVVAGEYRYFIDTKREGIIGCYSGVPISL